MYPRRKPACVYKQTFTQMTGPWLLIMSEYENNHTSSFRKTIKQIRGIHSLEDYLASAEVAGVQRDTEKLEKHHSEHKISQGKYLLYNSVCMELIRKKPGLWGQRSEWRCVLTVNRKELSGVTEQCASLSRCCVHNTLTPEGQCVCVCKSHDFCITTAFKIVEPNPWISQGLSTLVKITLLQVET